MALPADLLVLKDSPVYQPVLRSILKSQIQLLVEQLCETGEETLILTANIKGQNVTQLGSESGKQFVDMYDDFKSEFLGFCQRRDKKRKIESPQSGVLAKTNKTPKLSPRISTSSAISSAANTPKVSAARVIITQGVKTSQPSRSVVTETPQPSGQVVFSMSSEQDEADLEDSAATLGVLGMSDSEFVGYEEIEEHEVEGWDPNTVADISPPEQQDQSTSTTPNKRRKPQAGDKSDKVMSNVAKGSSEDLPVNFQRMFDKATSCPECGKLFIRSDALKLHLLSHTGEYPYQCEHCGADFRKKRSMDIHILKKHPAI